ncbi:MAG: peptidylprolyl isomerase [Calditrichaeota bacterium]|nr:peptidylprolyl isomerase [Calditrichota bacterium]HQU70920.1 peptidylprolyl isomerase [Calditrichia bacterium]
MRMFKFLMFFAVLMSLSGLQAQMVVDRIAAIVGNEIILESDLQTMLSQYGFQNRVDVFRDPVLRKKLSTEFLQRMIDDKVLLIKADEDTIKADDDRVDQYLEQQINMFIQQANGSVETLEKYYGMPLAKIRKEMRKQISGRMRVETLRQVNFGSVTASRREVEKFFQEYADSLPNQQEQVDISHILMQVTPSEEAAKTAFEKIEALRERVVNGEDFASVARQFSEDPSAKSNSGNLGFVSRGDLVKEFEEVAFNMEEGKISEPVQTQFGFHIIQLLERQGERINVRHILIQLQPTEADEQRTVQALQEIREKILSGEAAFEDMALEYSDDPNVQTDKGHLGLFATDNFQVQAFATTVEDMQPGEISQPFRTDFGYHILMLNDRISARTLSLQNDWQQIEQYALEYKRNQEFQKWLKELRAEIPIDVKIEI